MSPRELFEFRDLDGTYVVARPKDEVRAVVIWSNLVRAGTVLWKNAQLSWRAAAEDLGGYTRLVPSELLPGRGPAGREARSLLSAEDPKPASEVDAAGLDGGPKRAGAAPGPSPALMDLVRELRSLLGRWTSEEGPPGPAAAPGSASDAGRHLDELGRWAERFRGTWRSEKLGARAARIRSLSAASRRLRPRPGSLEPRVSRTEVGQRRLAGLAPRRGFVLRSAPLAGSRTGK